MSPPDAGRELDIEVMKALGYPELKPGQLDPLEGYFLIDPVQLLRRDANGRVAPFRPSFRIEDAWVVLERMRSAFSLWRRFTAALQWHVSVSLPSGLVAPEFVWRLVEPVHICRAAFDVLSAARSAGEPVVVSSPPEQGR